MHASPPLPARTVPPAHHRLLFVPACCLFLLGLLMLCTSAQAGGLGETCHVFAPCDDGYSCQPFVHKCYHSPRHENEPCSAGYGCAKGLTCEAGTHKCRAPGKSGDACHATRPCGPGLSCQPGVHKCYSSPRREGEPCSAGYGCASGLTCEAGAHVCRAPGKLGDSCHATRPCGSGLSCQPGVHKCYNLPRLAGQPCVAGHACADGLQCAAGKQVCEKPELKQCVHNLAAYSTKVSWYKPLDVKFDPATKSLSTTGSPVQVDDNVSLFLKSCNESDELRTAVVRVIGGEYANSVITIAAGTVVAIAGAAAGTAACVATAGTGCPAVISIGAAAITALSTAEVGLASLLLPDPEEIAYVGMPAKNQEVELKGTIWAPYYDAGSLRGGPAAHVGSPGMEQECYNKVQGKVAWNQAGTSEWVPLNIQKLCTGTTDPDATIACFKQGIAQHNDWSRAIDACKGKDQEAQCADLVQGKVAWNRSGDRQWRPENVKKLCAGSTSPTVTVACFQQGIEQHDDWSRAISDCAE